MPLCAQYKIRAAVPCSIIIPEQAFQSGFRKRGFLAVGTGIFFVMAIQLRITVDSAHILFHANSEDSRNIVTILIS
jgi:hypothetical protein